MRVNPDENIDFMFVSGQNAHPQGAITSYSDISVFETSIVFLFTD
jgi:hypothetical protein